MDSRKVVGQKTRHSLQMSFHRTACSSEDFFCQSHNIQHFALVPLVVAVLVFGLFFGVRTPAYAAPLITTTIELQMGVPEGDLTADGYAWDGSGELALDGLNLNVDDGDGIILPGGADINITVLGANSIVFSTDGNSNNYCGISTAISVDEGSIVFQGMGTLTITGTNNPLDLSGNTLGIYSRNGNLAFNPLVQISASATESAIRASGDITMTEADVTALATGTPDGCTAIISERGNINITSSTVNADSDGLLGFNTAIHNVGSGTITISDSTVVADASEATMIGHGILASGGDLSITRGRVEAYATQRLGSIGIGALTSAPPPPLIGRITLDSTTVIASGDEGISSDADMQIRNSQVTAQGNTAALATVLGMMTIDSSTVSATQSQSPGDGFGNGVRVGASLNIVNSAVEIDARGEKSFGLYILGQSSTLNVSASRLVAQGIMAGIVIIHPDQNDPHGAYVILGEGMAVLEGGALAFTSMGDPPPIFSTIGSYSLSGSISADNNGLYGASQRVVIALGTAPGPTPPIPATGDQLYMLGIIAGLLAGAFVLLYIGRRVLFSSKN